MAGEQAFVSSYPTLHPAMTLPRLGGKPRCFPFDQTSLRYYYLARNAIHALVQVWKLRGQEMLFPAYFHGVEVETLQAAGVKLRFFPVHAGMQVDPKEVAERITPQTRAVYLIHYLGFPGPVEEVSRICRERGIPLIEDCALALLSRNGTTPLGSYGDAAVFCLYKTLPVPNGGALLVRDAKGLQWPATTAPSMTSTLAYTATAIYRHLRFSGGGLLHAALQRVRNSARSAAGSLGVVAVGDDHLDPSKVDLAMSRMCHVVLGRQDYEGIVARRRRNFQMLLDRLGPVGQPVFRSLPEGVSPLFFPLVVRNKLELHRRLLANGVEAVNFWSRIPDFIPESEFPEVISLRRSVLELPCHQDLTEKQVDLIAERTAELSSELGG